ncbi:uncharacterized protein LOC124203690 [Daphnia pulex]|uniref:uncharacterized protein LOC124203690 n=1 Tax=Daphnia pulex TaxID=6669 RepID=UPI001EE0BB81|nr:uncharacterized protein LOC124203690 [Daphnia pulex]
MQRENEKSLSSPGAFVSPNSTSKILSQTLVSRPKGIAKQRRNEKQQVLYHLEQVIDVQEMLHALSTQSIGSAIRQDFLRGLQGAPQLSQEDIEILKTFHRLTTSTKSPKTLLEFVMNAPIEENLKASEHFKFLMEGERKSVPGTNITYYDGKAIISRILRSGYFSQRRLNNAKVKHENVPISPSQPTPTSQTTPKRIDYQDVDVDSLLVNLKKQMEETNRIV